MNLNDIDREKLAEIKGMSCYSLVFYLKKPDAPKPVRTKHGAYYYDRAECEAWNPTPGKRGRKPKKLARATGA